MIRAANHSFHWHEASGDAFFGTGELVQNQGSTEQARRWPKVLMRGRSRAEDLAAETSQVK